MISIFFFFFFWKRKNNTPIGSLNPIYVKTARTYTGFIIYIQWLHTRNYRVFLFFGLAAGEYNNNYYYWRDPFLTQTRAIEKKNKGRLYLFCIHIRFIPRPCTDIVEPSLRATTMGTWQNRKPLICCAVCAEHVLDWRIHNIIRSIARLRGAYRSCRTRPVMRALTK